MNKNFSELPLRTGVGIILLNDQNKVFVARRIDNAKNFWQMPQGGVDDGEDFLKAAYRELEEETSVKSVKLIKELDLTSDKLELIKPNITHIALGEDNRHIEFHRDFKKTAESISKLSEKDASNWEGFTLHIKKITNFLEKLYQITPPKVPNLSISDALSMRSILNPVLKYGTQGIVDLLRLVPMMMPEMMDEYSYTWTG